ncbi:MAG TPA: hypothetical protein VHF26_27075 [Trebonia sp.]|jgi:hypothetical protein|nr:hypothetical protein [Trebonia sp.]
MPRSSGGYAAAEYLLFHELPPAEGEKATWWVRTDSVVVGFSQTPELTRFTRASQPDEWMLLLPDAETTGSVTAGGQTREVTGNSLVTVPPGPSQVEVTGGRAMRIFTARNADLAARAVNADSYQTPHPYVTPAFSLPEPPGGYRIHSYALDAPPAPGCFGRIWRCTTVMLNYIFASDGPRDTTSLSPHAHDDFEQITFALDGDHVHHIRWPWGPDLAHWRDDEHRCVPAPSAAVIPARSLHTTRAIGAGHHQLADVFCPPRRDFADKGWVLNADDYPLEG